MEKDKALIISSVLIGIAFIAGVLIYGANQLKIQRMSDTLEVTGSATKTVQSDLAKLRASFSRTVKESQLSDGYSQMKSDEAAVVSFLQSNGFTESEYEISPVSMYEDYDYNKTEYTETKYNLSQNVSITSTDIQKVKGLSQKTDEIINQGVIYQINSPEYYYTKLPDERINLLPDAVQDAQKRAQMIAESTGRELGTLKEASMGVVQVMQPNSIDVSSYGTYDTSTIEKEIMITVRGEFTLD